jgi:glycosyltransferase involved in cell wall biosynthesis
MIGQKGIPTLAGGIERHVEELSLRLGRQGHEVLVYTRAWYAAPKRDLFPGVSTIKAPTIKSKHLDAIVHTLTSTIQAIKAEVDVIHYHGVGPSLLAWIPRIFAHKVKVVSTFHCIDRKHAKWGRMARLSLLIGEWAACKFPHATITVSRTLEAYCRDRFNCEARYIPNGITPVNEKSTSQLYLEKYNLVPGKYLLMVSRLVRHKGQHRLIAAYRHLKAQNRTNGMKLVFAGGSAFTDDYVSEIKAQAATDPEIIFTDNIQGEELNQIFTNAYMVVHPSSSEGLPIAVLEAMSYGHTVLGSDIPEIMEVTNKYGFAHRNRDVSHLIEKLGELIASPQLVKMTGEKARLFVETDYAWDDVATNVAELYTRVTQTRIIARRPIRVPNA